MYIFNPFSVSLNMDFPTLSTRRLHFRRHNIIYTTTYENKKIFRFLASFRDRGNQSYGSSVPTEHDRDFRSWNI